MSLNTVKAILILNAWTKETRMKAALARKSGKGKSSKDYAMHRDDIKRALDHAKKYGTKGTDPASKKLPSNRVARLEKLYNASMLKAALKSREEKAGGSSTQSNIQGGSMAGLASKKYGGSGLTRNAKKGWSEAARKKAAMTRKAKKKATVAKQQITTQLPPGVKVKHNSKGKAHYEYKGTTYTTLGTLKEGIKKKAQPVKPDTRSLYERRMDQFNS